MMDESCYCFLLQSEKSMFTRNSRSHHLTTLSNCETEDVKQIRSKFAYKSFKHLSITVSFFLEKIILTFIGPQNDSVTISHDRQNAQLDERQRHFFPIDFHPHFLQQRDFWSILEPDSDGSRPTKVQRVSGIIGDPH